MEPFFFQPKMWHSPDEVKYRALHTIRNSNEVFIKVFILQVYIKRRICGELSAAQQTEMN